MDSEATTPYTSIGEYVDKLIAVHGSPRTSRILQGILDNPDFYLKVKDTDREVLSCIISATEEVFEISKTALISGKTGKSSSARYSCYYLIKKHTGCSDQQIAGYFSNGNSTKSRASIQTGRTRVGEVLNNPKIDEHFYKKHTQLEEKINTYITENNLNTH